MFNRLKLVHAAAIAAFVFVFLAKSSGALTTSIRSSLATEAKNYDVVVIGGGSAGLTAAKFAKTFGQSVVIVEGNKMGGDCTWTGCVPSKSLVAAAARHYQITTSNRQSSQPESPADFTAIRKEIQEKIERIYDAEDSPQVMAKLGIDVIKGRATLTSPNRLQVSVEGDDNNSALLDIVAQQGIILCTGARPRIPTTDSISGIDDIDYLTYEQVWELEQLPKRLTIAGGGPVSVSSVYFAGLDFGRTEIRFFVRLLLSNSPDGVVLGCVFMITDWMRIGTMFRAVGIKSDGDCGGIAS